MVIQWLAVAAITGSDRQQTKEGGIKGRNSGKALRVIAVLLQMARDNSGAVQANNSWNLSVTANSADFSSLSTTDAKAARNSDGSLPSNGFARLVSGSDLIDKGVNVGIPYLGAAPDLGAYELQ